MATSPHEPIPFIDIPARELFPTLKALSDAGFTAEHAKLLRSSPEIAKQAFAAVDTHVPKGPEALHRLRFTALVGACRFSQVTIRAEQFPAAVFGEVGEGHVVDAPPKKRGTPIGDELAWGYWDDAEVEAWLVEKAKEGLEAASFADLLDYVARNRRSLPGVSIVCWGARNARGEVPHVCFDSRGGRMLVESSTNPIPGYHHGFLLRKIKKV